MTPQLRPGTSRWLSFIFFLSGAVALIYQVLWQRLFTLMFGSATPATAAVLAAFFTGLCIGNIVAQRLSLERYNPLRVYAVLELLIAMGALVVFLVGILLNFFPAFLSQLVNKPALTFIAKLLVATVALLLPTAAMGATLPVLSEIASGRERALGVSAGWLYVVNTAGAAVGALSVPFVLLPQLGAMNALRLCVALNVAIAVVSFAIAKALPPRAVQRADVRVPQAPGHVAVLWLSFLSGTLAFILQVLWNRAFAQVHENSIYSFAIIAVGFILALAIGGQISRRLLVRKKAPLTVLGWSWLMGGCLVTATPWIFLRFTNTLNYIGAGGEWTTYSTHLVALILAAVVVPVSIFGVGFPALLEHAGRVVVAPSRAVVGKVLSVNLAGAVVGSLLAALVLPQVLGLWSSIVSAGAILALVGLHYVKPRWSLRIAGTIAAILLVLGAANLPRVRIAATRGERLISVSEGAHGIVAVTERPNSRRLKLNNHYVLGGSAATGDERMQCHLPLLLHPAPRRVALLGVGTGITASGALFHPIERLAAVELVPEVIRVAREHFAAANLKVLEDVRTTVVMDDARNFLRGSQEKFDVIVGDLVVPWRPGEGALFTLEQFDIAKSRLATNGIFCQWLPLFQLSETELEIVLRTILQVFPRVALWRGDFSPTEPALGLVCGNFDADVIERRLAEMKPDPANPQLKHAELFWMHFLGWIDSENPQLRAGRINTEDRPWIELLAPMAHSGERPDVLMTGRRLQAWCQKMEQGTNRDPGEAQKRGRAAGDLLFEISLLTLERRPEEARGAHEELKTMLSPEAFIALFPPQVEAGLKTP